MLHLALLMNQAIVLSESRNLHTKFNSEEHLLLAVLLFFLYYNSQCTKNRKMVQSQIGNKYEWLQAVISSFPPLWSLSFLAANEFKIKISKNTWGKQCEITLFSDFSALCNYYFLRIQFPHQKLVALLGCFPSNTTTTSHSNFFIPPPEALFILQEVTNNAVQTYVFYFCVTREGESYSATPLIV